MCGGRSWELGTWGVHRTQRKNAEFIPAAGEKEGQGVSGKYFWGVGHLSMKFSKNKLELRV